MKINKLIDINTLILVLVHYQNSTILILNGATCIHTIHTYINTQKSHSSLEYFSSKEITNNIVYIRKWCLYLCTHILIKIMVLIKINKSVLFSKVRISPVTGQIYTMVSYLKWHNQMWVVLLSCIIFYLFLKFVFVKLWSHMKEKPVSYVTCNLLLIQNYH